MQHVILGHSGIRVSRLCLGCMTFGDPSWRDWVLDEAASRPIIRSAFEAGINFFSTASIYSRGSSEQVTGTLLREIARRDEYVLATMIHNPASGRADQRGRCRANIQEAVNGSLDRLGVDHVDLLVAHGWDIATPITETMEALNEVVEAGKARYLGASTMYAWQFARAQHVAELHGWQRFVSLQNHYNLVYREDERELIPQCRDMGVALTPWSPLARGFLAGNRYRQGGGGTLRAHSDRFAQCMYFTDADFAIAEAVDAVASNHDAMPAQVALAWMLSKPAITAPIIGATSPAQLEELSAAIDLTLADEEIQILERPYHTRAILGHG